MNFLYNDYAKIILDDNHTHSLLNLSKKCKTRTITNGSWKQTILTKNIKVSPKTYWKVSGYDQLFEGNDAYCFLCKKAFIDYNSCNCPEEGFTVEEHNNKNINIARKNYLISICSHLSEDSELFKKIEELTNVDHILFSKTHIIKMVYPPRFDYKSNYTETNRMIKHLNKVLKLNLELKTLK